MKVKGVNIFEQHFEKGILGLTVLGLLAVLALQFAAPPKVDVGTAQVAPDQIYAGLGNEASLLQGQLTDSTPALPDVEPVNLLARYDEALGESRTARTLSEPLGEGVDIASAIGTEIDTQPQDVGPIEALRVPQTTGTIAASQWATLDPFALRDVPEYGDIVRGDQPLDFASVSIEAEFSGSELRRVLQGADGSPRVPRNFWVSTGMAVMALEAERQEMNADGTWGRTESISVSPGMAIPTRAVRVEDGLVRLNDTITNARNEAEEVQRPPFPPTISGVEWTPPSERAGSTAALSEEEQLQRRLARLEREIERLGNARSSSASVSRSDDRGGRSGGGGRGTRAQVSTSVSSGGSRSNANADRVDRLEEEAEEIRDRLDQLGVEAEDSDAAPRALLDLESVQLWTHDLGVEPGKTYRYRTRVVVNNPYFRKGPYLDTEDPAQLELTKAPFSRGQWSGWSDPVSVGSRQLFFIADSVAPRGTGGQPEVKLDLYAMYYGYYRRRSHTLSPGEPLLQETSVSDDLVTIDTAVADLDAVADYLSGEARDEDEAVPEGISPAPRRIRVPFGTTLIDIISDPLDPQGGLTLLLRASDGTLIRRTMASDLASALAEQASSTASVGARAKLRAPGSRPARSPAYELFLPVEEP